MKRRCAFAECTVFVFGRRDSCPQSFAGMSLCFFGNGFMGTTPNSESQSAGPVNTSSESAFESAVPHYIHEKANLCRLLEDFQFIFIAILSEVWYTGENSRKKVMNDESERDEY